MNCHELHDALIMTRGAAARQWPLQVVEHLENCKRCQEFAAALDQSVASSAPSSAALTQIEQEMVADLRPVRPIAPRRYFYAAFAGTFVLTVAIGVYRLGAFALAAMSPVQAGTILGSV